MEWVAWSDEYAPTCPACRDMYGNRNPPQETPCQTCRVELSAANQEVATVYMLCRRQYVTAEEGRIAGLSIPAVKALMDIYGVRNQRECLERVLAVFYYFENKRSQGR
jgi:hypothetical protein